MNAEQARKSSDDVNRPRFHDIYESLKGRIADAVANGEYSVNTTLHLPGYVMRLLRDEGFKAEPVPRGTTIYW